MSDPGFKFECGDKVKHSITGFTGIVVARSEWLNGCRRYGVEATKLSKDGDRLESHFDEGELGLVKARAIKIERAAAPPGGPMPDEKRLSHGNIRR